jgi:ABC-type bacteriocin/lantibiotic exporter with double-glycine peptidase domain
MSYGYEPPKQNEPGSWSEVFVITKVAFQLLAPFLAGMLGLIIVFIAMILLFAQHPALALIPLIPVAAVVYYVLRRERLAHEEEVRRVQGR